MIIRRLFFKASSNYRFYFSSLQSPTAYNLASHLKNQGWQATKYAWRANFGEQHLAFDNAVAEQLEFKHLLAQLLAGCEPALTPKTYCINDQNWVVILDQLEKTYYRQSTLVMDEVENLVWILKPSLLNNGQAIHIFKRLSQLRCHYNHTNRMGGEHVLQRYVLRPQLIKGHKYSIRLFVILTNYDGAYLYPKGYFNVALQPYQTMDFKDIRSHLTNEHLSNSVANIIQIPTDRFDFFPILYMQIKTMLITILQYLNKKNPHPTDHLKRRTLAIFGFDFITDQDQRIWLLEANHGPCFPTVATHMLQTYLYHDFWQAFIHSFVLPIAQQRATDYISYAPFERLELS